MKEFKVYGEYSEETGKSYSTVTCGNESVTYELEIEEADAERLGPAAKRLRGPEICTLRGERYFLIKEKHKLQDKLKTINNFINACRQDKRFDENCDTVKVIRKQKYIVERDLDNIKLEIASIESYIKLLCNR